ncbi:MAG: AMP-binding protein [Nevskiales bacterium]|nr:AMP-binding protein [Nevskiales bacterium]
MRTYDYFRRAEQKFPERPAFISDAVQYSFRQMGERSRRVGSALANKVSREARVAVYSPNDVEAFACVLGTFFAGGCWVTLNARNAIDENVYILANTECEVLFLHSSMARHLGKIREGVPTLQRIVCIDRELDGCESLDTFVSGVAASLPELPEEPGRLVSILSTGGTTGRPKGVMWTQRVWEAIVATFWIHQQSLEPPVQLVCAPMTHAAGVLAMALMPAGATTVVLDHFEPLDVMEAIQRHRITHLFLPPTAIYMMLGHPRVRDFDYSSLRCFLYAASPMAADKLREAIDVFGPVMVQSYGQAEAPMFCTMMTVEDHLEALSRPEWEHRLWSCGRPTMLTRLAIMGDDGALLPPGERGEIVVGGSLVMDGYYKNPEATAEVSANGWHRTGDVGYQDEAGFVYHVDRKKDMIITGGFNVYSAEVEKIVLSHPSIQDCAVIGVPDDKWGEAVKAVVQTREGCLIDPDEIIALCKERIGSIKAPKSVDIWPELPRSPVGKVLKRDIRARFWQDRSRGVS